jgi:geranylgeranyl reductase family protein
MQVRQYDVIIVGGGPAGCTAALALAGSGLKVVVLEKNIFPRDKVCGDAVASYVPKVLQSINPEFARALNGFNERVTVNACRLVAPNRKFFDLQYVNDGFIAKRLDWDNFLYELVCSKTETDFFPGHQVKDARIDTGTKEVTVIANDILFKGKILIGCDGAHSIVSKSISPTRIDLDHYSGAVRAYYKNVTDIPVNTFELHFFEHLLPGYFWIFPLKDNMANVGLGMLSSQISKRKIDLRSSMQNVIETIPHIQNRFLHAERIGKIEGFGLPLGSRKIKLSGDHFMLCGDAGALIDPLSGEGIGQAMVSGRYAGWHAKKCFEHDNFGGQFMKQYDEQVYRKFWKRHRKNYWIQRMIADRSWLMNGIFNTALQSSFVTNILAKGIA